MIEEGASIQDNSDVIKRLPRFAETKLQSLCAAAGALCQEVSEDESGWDYLIEFPQKPHRGPADTHPPANIAYVQVKSAQKYRATCRIKLSNALRAAQSRQPWFIVFMVRSADEQQVKVFAVHVWKELIGKILKAVRKNEYSGHHLNKAWITIPFNDHARNDDLIDWMHETIGSIGSDYEQKKKTIFETIGFESGSGTVQLTIVAPRADEVTRSFLGLGDELKVTRFIYTPSRFGITSPTPDVDVSSGTVQITPQPAATCEIQIRAQSASQPIVLWGNVYTLGIPGLSADDQSARFSAEFLELLWKPGRRTTSNAKLAFKDKVPLQTIEKFATLNAWLDDGPVSVQVWIQGQRVTTGKISRDKQEFHANWDELVRVVRLLRSISGDKGSLKVSIDDLVQASGLRTFTQVMSGVSFRLEFEPIPQTPSKIESLMYYFFVDVGDHVYYALVERKVVEDVMIEGRRRITASGPDFLETYVLSSPNENDRQMMKADYERHLTQRQAINKHPLGLGDLREYLASLANDNDDDDE